MNYTNKKFLQTESGNCGNDDEKGPHFIQCLSRLWREAGCSEERFPTKNPESVRHWNSLTVEEVRRDMAESSLCQKKECFLAHATVLTSDGSKRTMAELRLGDRVLAVDAAGQFTFSEVLLWLDWQRR